MKLIFPAEANFFGNKGNRFFYLRSGIGAFSAPAIECFQI